MTHHKIVIGDCLEVMKGMTGESVDLVVTSPPYNAGKEYENLLTEKEYLAFVEPRVWEIERVLKDDGRFAVNVVFNIKRIDNGGKSVLFPYFS